MKKIGYLRLYPHYFELMLGEKKLALCHFENDVRIYFTINSTWSYQSNIKLDDGYKQFLYTNSLIQKKNINKIINMYGINNPFIRGYVSAIKEP